MQFQRVCFQNAVSAAEAITYFRPVEVEGQLKLFVEQNEKRVALIWTIIRFTY